MVTSEGQDGEPDRHSAFTPCSQASRAHAERTNLDAKSSLSRYSCHLSASHWANLNSQKSVGTFKAKPRQCIINQELSFFFFSLKRMFSIKALAFLKKPFQAKKTFVLPWFGSHWRTIFLLLLQGERFQWQNSQPNCP